MTLARNRGITVGCLGLAILLAAPTAFTDGFRSWVNGPYGLQERLNSARFSWEAPASSATVAPAVYSGVGAAASQPELDRMGSQFFSLLNTVTGPVLTGLVFKDVAP